MYWVVRFGPFELDTETGELRKNGVPLRLRQQSIEILAELAGRPGELVTREELREKLWPGVRYADFDNGLNTAMNRLRGALRDTPQEPRYIETLPRRGYRFLAHAERVRKGEPRIAVLPFKSLNRETGSRPYSEVVTDALITELGVVSSLRVLSRQSTLHFANTEKTIPEIGAELRVDAVIEGSVLYLNGRLRVTVQLIQVEPEQHLWANVHNCAARDILTSQGHIVKGIADSIRVVLSPLDLAQLNRARPVVPDAHVLYLQGKHLMERWTRDALERGIECFERVVAKDSSHALAHAWMGECYALLGHWGFMPFSKAFLRAKNAAIQSLAIDPALSTGHWVFGWALWLADWDLNRCEAELLEAIALNASEPGARNLYALFLICVRKKVALAFSESQHALDLAPLSQDINTSAAWIRLFGEDYEGAIRQANRTLELFPASLHAHNLIGLSQLGKGKLEESLQAFESAVAVSRNAISLGFLGHVKARLGDIAGARAILEEVLSLVRTQSAPPRAIAFIHAGLGETDLAFEWLERAYTAHDSGLFFQPSMPIFASIRKDPRFTSLLRRVGLPTVAARH